MSDGVVVEVPFEGALDMRRTLDVGLGPTDPTMRLLPDGSVAWSMRTPSGPATVHAAIVTDPCHVRLEAWGPGAQTAVARAPDMLGLDDDPLSFRPADPRLRGLVRRFHGLRVSRGRNVSDLLVPTILAQRVTFKEASMAYRALVRRFGGESPGPMQLPLPPDPAQLGRLTQWQWREIMVDQDRARTLVDVGRRAERYDRLGELPAQEAYERLLAVRGIGPWTANIVLAYSHGWEDAVPTGDVHLPHAVTYLLAGEERGSDERMLELLEPYRPRRWRAVRLIMSGASRAPRRGRRRGVPKHRR